MRFAVLLLVLGSLAAHAQDYPVPSLDRANITTEQELHIESAPATAQQSDPAQPERVQSRDLPDDDDDEEETPWTLYAAMAGFVLLAAVIFLVVSRASRSRKG
jgi:hypothetical protein